MCIRDSYISDVKKFIKSNSYQAAFEFLGLLNEISTLEKQLTAIKIKKGQDPIDAVSYTHLEG